MPTQSSLPSVNIPNIGLWDFLFERTDREFPDDKELFVDPYTKRSYTYAQVKQAAVDFGKGLKGAWEWQKGDVLACYTPNNIDFAPVVWGTLWAGGIVSPANPGYSVDELAFQLKDSGAKALVTQYDQLENALKAAEKVGIPQDRVILLGDKRDPNARIKHFSSIRNLSGTSRFRRAKVDPENDLAFLVYSSGTTGLPKGVMLCHRNIIANTLMNHATEAAKTSDGMTWKPTPERPEGDSILAFLPFFHIYGLTVVLHQSMHAGYKCVVMPKFELEAWCKIVDEQRISFAYVVPPVVLQLAKHPIVDKYDLSSLRMMNSGAAPLTKEIVDALWKRKNLKVKQGYGLSETSPTTHTQPWDRWYSTIGSVGMLLPNQTAKYMSPEDKELPIGEVGELWIKGPNIFKGYLNNVEGTRNALTEDGYFKTGDVGYQDKDGNFYITDRVKELIKVSRLLIGPPCLLMRATAFPTYGLMLTAPQYKGFQVPPAELEGYLASHEKVADVAVIGIYQEEQATEVPLAYVVPKEGKGSKELEKELVDWLGAKVANHKKLRGGVKFTDVIPKSATGKILRRMLKVKYEEELKKSAKPRAKL